MTRVHMGGRNARTLLFLISWRIRKKAGKKGCDLWHKKEILAEKILFWSVGRANGNALFRLTYITVRVVVVDGVGGWWWDEAVDLRVQRTRTFRTLQDVFIIVKAIDEIRKNQGADISNWLVVWDNSLQGWKWT